MGGSFFNEAAISRSPDSAPKQRDSLIKARTPKGYSYSWRKVDAAHYEWSITYHYQLPQRSSTLDKLYRVFHRYSARLKVSFAP